MAVQPGFCTDSVRRNDPDRYVLAMLAPATIRGALFALYAFNVELARTRELVSEPPLGEIRLQWWRDGIAAVYAGEGFSHGVGDDLARAIDDHDLSRAHFDRLIVARSADLVDSPPETIDELLRYAEDTTAPLLALALEVSGERSPAALEAARHIGIAWSLIGLVRALPFHLRARRHYLPRDLTRRHGVGGRDLFDIEPGAGLNEAIRELSQRIEFHLQAARSGRRAISRLARPVLLQARFAEIHLRRLAAFGFDPFDARLAEPPRMAAWRLAAWKISGRY